MDGTISIRQPTIFLDLNTAPAGTAVPDKTGLPDRTLIESILIRDSLNPLLEEVRHGREREIKTISDHMELSLHTLIDKAQCQYAELFTLKEAGSTDAGLDGRLKIAEDRIDELNNRLEHRRSELQMERQCSIGNIQHLGTAWVLPHPDRKKPEVANMVADPEIEKIAVRAVMEHEEARGWKVQSVENENRGFDLISRKPHPEDPQTAIEVRFIEVKGRSSIAEVALSTNEYKTAERLKKDYWLYVVFNCASKPEIHVVQDPTKLGWKPIIKVEHYQVSANVILQSEA
jgi:hypothetical protein